jgi:hypothetical protein
VSVYLCWALTWIIERDIQFDACVVRKAMGDGRTGAYIHICFGDHLVGIVPSTTLNDGS